MNEEERASLLRLRAAVDRLLEKGYGFDEELPGGRGREADDASTNVAMKFGALPIERARAIRLRDQLRKLVDSKIGPLTIAQGIALADARRELEHDRSVFPPEHDGRFR